MTSQWSGRAWLAAFSQRWTSLGLRLLSTTDVGAHRAPCDSATDSGDIVTASATDLVTENAANYGADDRARNVELASILRDLFLLDPASLLGCSDHRMH